MKYIHVSQGKKPTLIWHHNIFLLDLSKNKQINRTLIREQIVVTTGQAGFSLYSSGDIVHPCSSMRCKTIRG